MHAFSRSFAIGTLMLGSMLTVGSPARADDPEPSAPFTFDCAHRPFAHPYFRRPGLKGVCVAKEGQGAEAATFREEAPNTVWALWKLAYRVCVKESREVSRMTYACAWVASP